MSIYKKITNEDLTTSKTQVYKTHTLDSASSGVSNYKFNSESSSLETIGSYYNSLKINYYLSVSDYADSESRFNTPFYRKAHHIDGKESVGIYPLYVNKFHTFKKGHLYSIPQDYFGQMIKPGTFTLTDTSQTYALNIKDDGFGNLYANNATISSSGDTAISSSENYIGNIFYETGVATVTETGSFSGSASYLDLGTNYSMSSRLCI